MNMPRLENPEVVREKFADSPLAKEAEAKTFKNEDYEQSLGRLWRYTTLDRKPPGDRISEPEPKHLKYGNFSEANNGQDVREIKKGGAYKDLPNEEGKEKHHMPANATTDISFDDGPCIVMDKSDHRQTASCGNSKEAQEYRERQKQLIEEGKFEEALQMDIDDIHDKFGDKYDEAIGELLDYCEQMKQEGKTDEASDLKS